MAAFLLLAFGGCTLVMWPIWGAHHVPPHVDGALFRATLPEAAGLFSPFEVFPIGRKGQAIAVVRPGNLLREAELVVLRFPSGEVLERVDSCSSEHLASVRSEAVEIRDSKDFDGDGIADRTVTSDVGHGRALVVSGADEAVLFESVDDLEYESNERLTLLGDLDGDGYSELAVTHPRSDRSDYDFEPIDGVIGARSWVHIVSGKLATEERRARLGTESR